METIIHDNFFWSYYIIMMISLISVILIGYIVLHNFRIPVKSSSSHISLFTCGVVGSFLIVSVCACYFTGVRSVMICIPIIFSALGLNFHSSAATTIKQSYYLKSKVYFEFFIVSFLIYSFNYAMIFYHASLLSTPHPDIIFHSKLSTYLSTIGIESRQMEYLYVNSVIPQPYHYFEAWMTCAIDMVFKKNNLLLLTLVVFSMLTILIYAGYCALLKCILERDGNLLSSVICLLSIFFIGVYFSIYKEIPLLKTVSIFARNPFNYAKLSVIYICIISTFLFSLYKQEKAAVISLLILPILFISCAPGVFVGVGLYYILCYFRDRNIILLIKNIGFVIILGLIILMIYYPNNNSDGSNSVTRASDSLAVLDWRYFRTGINVFAGTTIQLIFLYLPMLFIFNYTRVKFLRPHFRVIVMLPLAITSLSLGFWALLHHMPDAIQLFSNFSIVFLNIISFIIVIYAFKVCDNTKRIVVVFLYSVVIVLSLVNTVIEIKTIESTNQIQKRNLFFQQLQKKFANIKPIGIFLRSKEEYNSVFMKNSNFSTLANYLVLLNDKCHQISLSVYDIPLNKNSPFFQFESKMVASSTFNRFVMTQKQSNTFVSIEDSQLAFIDFYHIQYMVISAPVIVPRLIQNRVKEILVEPVTKERIMLLK